MSTCFPERRIYTTGQLAHEEARSNPLSLHSLTTYDTLLICFDMLIYPFSLCTHVRGDETGFLSSGRFKPWDLKLRLRTRGPISRSWVFDVLMKASIHSLFTWLDNFICLSWTF